MPFCTRMGTQLSCQAEIFVLAWIPYHDRRTKTTLRLHRPTPRPQRKVVMENLLIISQGHPRLFFLRKLSAREVVLVRRWLAVR